MSQRINLAIVAPQNNVYSETFIQIQKQQLPHKIYFYYGGNIPTHIEGEGYLIKPSLVCNLLYRISKWFNSSKLSYIEWKVLKHFKKKQIQAVLAQYGPVGMALLNVCKIAKIPLITHFHGADAYQVDFLKRYKNYKELFPFSRKIICVSKHMEEQLSKLGCPPEKLVYNVYAPRKSFFEVNPKFDTRRFVALGRFTDKKAPYYTILSFKKVHELCPDARLVLGGDGHLLPACKNIVRYLGLNDVVSFPGVVTEREFQNYLEHCLAFVQHSITAEDGDREGTPNAILEAQAAGIPVISTRHTGIHDVVEHEETGYLVDEHDVEGMAEMMIILLKRRVKDLVQSGQIIKNRTKKRFNINEYINKINEAILEL